MERAKKPAPSGLAHVQDFVNSTKLLYREEGLRDPDSLRCWLADRRLIAGDEPINESTLEQAIDLRESLRALMLANTSGDLDPHAVDVFNGALDNADVRPRLVGSGAAALAPRVEGVDGAFGALVTSAMLAMIDGSWERLKACANHDCQWSFYDRSPNHSGTWCEMAVCGSRAKMRAYRNRRAVGRP